MVDWHVVPLYNSVLGFFHFLRTRRRGATIEKQHFRSKKFPRSFLKRVMRKTGRTHLRKQEGFFHLEIFCFSIVAGPQKKYQITGGGATILFFFATRRSCYNRDFHPKSRLTVIAVPPLPQKQTQFTSSNNQIGDARLGGATKELPDRFDAPNCSRFGALQ